LFFDKGTGSVDFVDGPNGPILCLKEEDSKNDEQICLYRHISNSELDLGDGNGDVQKQYQQIFKQVNERIIDSSVSIEFDDESSFNDISKQFSNSTVVSAHILREENNFDTNIKLKISVLGELISCTLYQSPLEPTLIFDMIPACILTSINYMIRISIIQLASLPSVIVESDVASLWQHKSPLNIRLNDNNRNVQDQQGLKLAYDSKVVVDGSDRDQSNIPDDFTDLENQRHAHRDSEDNVVILQERDNMKESDEDSSGEKKNEKAHLSSSQVFESLPCTNQQSFESMND
jgi:hypothetical protein